MKAALAAMLAALTVWVCACSEEPDRLVRSTTPDGEFALALEAQEAWVRPGGTLPILVRLERLSGPVDAELVETIELTASNGSVDPSSLVVVLAGPDSTGAGADSTFSGWVTFSSSSYGSSTQETVYALFRDLAVSLDIRIQPQADD